MARFLHRMNHQGRFNMGNDRLWSKSFIFLFLLGFLNTLGFSFTSPLVSKYSILLGASLTVAGTVAGIFSVTAMCMRPFSGYIADSFNKKKLAIFAALGTGIALLAYSIADSIWLICIIRFLHGLFYAICGTASHSMLYKVAPKSRIGEAVGLMGFSSVIATAIGPRVGVALGDLYGYSFSFVLSGATTLLASLFACFITYENSATLERVKKPSIKNFIAVNMIPLAMVSGLFSMTSGIISSFLVMLGEERNIVNISLFFTIKSFSLMGTRLLVSKIADKSKLSWIYYPSVIFEIITMVSLARASMIGAIVVAAICKACGQGIGQPAIQAEIYRRTDPALVGVATSTFYLASDAGQGLGPILGGFISEKYGYTTMFYVFAGLMILGALFYTFTANKKFRNKTDRKGIV